jgi:DNA-binding SARP family transcriptional activator
MLSVRMLGALTLARDGQAVPLPSSRKVRALFAYLALAPRPMSRAGLCELLWDVPNDPRGELRWCLSKIRGAIDSTDRTSRVSAADDGLLLDLAGCDVDAIEVDRAARQGVTNLEVRAQRALLARFGGEFLEGLEIERSPAFDAWLTAQRRHFRNCRISLLEQLAQRGPEDEVLGHFERWLQLAPFDVRAHRSLFAELIRRGDLPEAERHLATTLARFDAVGLDHSPIREAWREIRARRAAAAPARAVVASAHAERDGGLVATPVPRRASIAVMPFLDQAPTASYRGGLADALAYDITTRLAKLRSLFVIAQGSVFALHERRVGPQEAGRMLNVDYIVSGTALMRGQRLYIVVELVETHSARIVWSESLNEQLDGAFAVLETIGNRVVASVAGEIETLERHRALLKPPSSLDAWEAHHRGLWHAYRFTREDNATARDFFETAVRLDPTFSRAYAGLSFTHFQNAFQGWSKPEDAIETAYRVADQSLQVDERDPAAHLAMGRALWLRGGHGASIAELQSAIDLSPNLAQAHYALAFVQAQAGDPASAITASDWSRSLSPFDPLLFAMFAVRSVALVRLGRFEESAEWADRAIARPNAHPHIFALAACSLGLAGKREEAVAQVAKIRSQRPDYRMADLLASFHFAPDGEALFRKGAKVAGLA